MSLASRIVRGDAETDVKMSLARWPRFATLHSAKPCPLDPLARAGFTGTAIERNYTPQARDVRRPSITPKKWEQMESAGPTWRSNRKATGISSAN